MGKLIHAISGVIALVTILTFWLLTVWSELFGSRDAIIAVKQLIPWGFCILVPALALAGVSGNLLSRKRRGPLVAAKLKRMPVVAANGLLILVPSALFLSFKAEGQAFDVFFYAVQFIELIAGAVNITLLGLNMRDGLRLSGRMRRPA